MVIILSIIFLQKKLDNLRVSPHNMHHDDKSSIRMHGQYLPVALG